MHFQQKSRAACLRCCTPDEYRISLLVASSGRIILLLTVFATGPFKTDSGQGRPYAAINYGRFYLALTQRLISFFTVGFNPTLTPSVHKGENLSRTRMDVTSSNRIVKCRVLYNVHETRDKASIFCSLKEHSDMYLWPELRLV